MTNNKVTSRIGREIAAEVGGLLSSSCERWEVVGSLRRGEDKIKDIDLIALPRYDVEILQPALIPGYGKIDSKWEKRYSYLDQAIKRKMGDGGDYLIDSIGGTVPKIIHQPTGIKVEIYTITEERQWGIAKVFRTGHHLFSKEIATMALWKHWHITNYLLHTHEKEGKEGNKVVCRKGNGCKLAMGFDSEEEFFIKMGLPYLEPEVRTVKMLEKYVKEGLGMRKETKW